MLFTPDIHPYVLFYVVWHLEQACGGSEEEFAAAVLASLSSFHGDAAQQREVEAKSSSVAALTQKRPTKSGMLLVCSMMMQLSYACMRLFLLVRPYVQPIIIHLFIIDILLPSQLRSAPC